LFGMSAGKPLDRYDFNDELSFDQKIAAKCRLESEVVIFDIDRRLSRDGISHRRKQCAEDGLVNRLEQPRPEITMQPQSLIDHVCRNRLQVHNHFAPPRLRVNQTLLTATLPALRCRPSSPR